MGRNFWVQGKMIERQKMRGPVSRSLNPNGHWDVTLVRALEKMLWCWTGKQLLRSSKLTTRDDSVEILSFGWYKFETKKRVVHSTLCT